MQKLLFTFAAIMASAAAVHARDQHTFKGRVIYVKDGDTIVVASKDSLFDVRLSSIDCPEKDQRFGPESKKVTETLCLHKKVTVKSFTRDRYGRIVGEVRTTACKSSVNSELVRTGAAWWYQAFAKNASELQQIELSARQSRIGLWQEDNPVAPWDWRHHKLHNDHTTVVNPHWK